MPLDRKWTQHLRVNRGFSPHLPNRLSSQKIPFFFVPFVLPWFNFPLVNFV